MNRLCAWLLLSALASIGSAEILGPVRADEIPGPADSFIRFQNFQTHGRIEFRVDPSVPVQWADTPKGFSLFFKGATLVDFGAPFGDEERWAASFAGLRNPRLASIRFREVSGGVRVEGTWRFPSGPNAPAEPRMDTFNYRENNPSRFVVDFWTKPGPTLAELRARQAAEAKRLAVLRRREGEKESAARRIASEQARQDQEDLTHFCREPLRDDRDIFLAFRAVHEPIDLAKYLPTGSPDQDYSYYRPEGDAADAQYARLALDLYAQGKYALVLRTLEFLSAEHPKTSYRNEMNFLRANALLKLGMKDEGERALEAVRLDAKGTPAALHAALFLAVRVVAKGSPIATEEAFSWLIENYPGNHLAWLFHLAVAESLYDIEQTGRAAAEYQWVAEKAPSEELRALASFRIGDLYLSRWQYEQALGAYLQGIHDFPKQAAESPSIHLNRAESLAGLQEFGEARQEYAKVLHDFPAYPDGWRASLRLGEIAARQNDGHEEARRWYFDTINRFPFSPGATLARLRLIPCDDHGGFTAESAVRFFSGEAKAFDFPRALSMVRYPDLRAQTRVRSLISFGKDEQAMAAISEESPSLSSIEVRREFGVARVALLRRVVLTKLREGGGQPEKAFYDALAFYQQHRSEGGEDESVNPDYLLALSHAASDLGLGKTASELAAAYSKAAIRNRAIAAEDGDSTLKKGLEKSDERFAEAEALWISQPADDGKNDDEIRKKLDQVVAESRYSLEKEVILGLLEERRGKPVTALAHAAKAELLATGRDAAAGASRQPSRGVLRVRAWLASLESRAGDSEAALDIYRMLEKSMPRPAAKMAVAESKSDAADDELTLLGMPELPTLEQVLLEQGMTLERRSRWGEAAAAYSRAVDSGLGGNQARYGLARALLKSGGNGNRKKALTLLGEISNSKTEDFWRDMASKTLEVEQGSGVSPGN